MPVDRGDLRAGGKNATVTQQWAEQQGIDVASIGGVLRFSHPGPRHVYNGWVEYDLFTDEWNVVMRPQSPDSAWITLPGDVTRQDLLDLLTLTNSTGPDWAALQRLALHPSRGAREAARASHHFRRLPELVQVESRLLD